MKPMFLPCCVTVLAALFGGPVQAAPVDVILALDHSGSMKRTDPNRDSVQGVELFADLLGKDDRLEFMGFAGRAETLLPLTAGSGPAVRERLSRLARALPMNGQRTDFSEALRLAYEDLIVAAAPPDTRRMVVIFSDGQLDLGDAAANNTAQALILALLPEFRAVGIKVYCVAFSPEADLAFLGRIAEATGGRALRAERVADIYKAFIRLFEQTDQPLSVPVRDGRVAVDKEVRELKLLVERDSERERIRLVDPSGKEFDGQDKALGLEWRHHGPFDRITVPRPAVGTWRMLGASGEKKAYLDSDLDLGMEVHPPIRVGRPVEITVRLSYRGQPVSDQRLLEGLKVEVTGHGETGMSLEPLAWLPDARTGRPGEFHGLLRFAAEGGYRLAALAENPVFQRGREMSVTVLAAEPAAIPPAAAAPREEGPSPPVPVPAASAPVPGPPPPTAGNPSLGGLGWIVALNLVLVALVGGGVWFWNYRSGRDKQQILALRAARKSTEHGVPPRRPGPMP